MDQHSGLFVKYAEPDCNEELSDDETSKEEASATKLGEELKRLAASEANLKATNA